VICAGIVEREWIKHCLSVIGGFDLLELCTSHPDRCIASGICKSGMAASGVSATLTASMDVDEWISQLMGCKHLSEDSVRKLTERVSPHNRLCTAASTYS
jgi:hypothetical protein